LRFVGVFSGGWFVFPEGARETGGALLCFVLCVGFYDGGYGRVVCYVIEYEHGNDLYWKNEGRIGRREYGRKVSVVQG